ncbi:sugar transferase [Kitasatospora sp. NPDC057015]|uniref:sugar transferase n=1 Tax=Kitasatospora sp. NPDC057015 TaxID=3346001 RepID=UPI00362B5527
MRRAGDLAVISVAAVSAIPLGLLIALLLRGTTGGPVLVRRTVLGRHGREFELLRFRTLRDARFPGEPEAARSTRLGGLLRRTGLVELPQLWNVVRGEMGVVGPRPTLPERAVRLSPGHRDRLAVRPGLTGWAQVGAREPLTADQRLAFDLWYVEHRSTRLDLRILALAGRALLRPGDSRAAGGPPPPGAPVDPPCTPPQGAGAAEGTRPRC